MDNLRHLGCPRHFVYIIQSFHGLLSEPINVRNSIKLCELLAPTLFSKLFSVVLFHIFKDCDQGVFIRYHATSKLFNIRLSSAKSISNSLPRLFGCNVVIQTEQEMQVLMDIHSVHQILWLSKRQMHSKLNFNIRHYWLRLVGLKNNSIPRQMLYDELPYSTRPH